MHDIYSVFDTTLQFRHLWTLQVEYASIGRYDFFYHFPNLTSFSLTSGGSLPVLIALLNAFLESKAPLRYLRTNMREEAKAAQCDAFEKLLPHVDRRG